MAMRQSPQSRNGAIEAFRHVKVCLCLLQEIELEAPPPRNALTLYLPWVLFNTHIHSVCRSLYSITSIMLFALFADSLLTTEYD